MNNNDNVSIEMKLVSLNWAKIKAIGYDPKKEFLYVSNEDGKTLAYKGVEESYYNNILRTNSPAIYIHNHIINSIQKTYETMNVNLVLNFAGVRL